MEMLTTKQASEILGVSRRRVIALIEQGKLKARKFSNVYFILPRDLDAVRDRKNGRPDNEPEKFMSFAEAAAEYIGSIKSDDLPYDLSNKKKYLRLYGFGSKKGEKMQRRSTKRRR